MGEPRDTIAQAFGDIARTLSGHTTIDATVDEICRLAVETVDGCRAAGISLVQRGGRIETPAATDQLAYDLHNAQYDLGQGPCLDATFKQHTVVIDDMSTDDRWPRFAARAVERGVHSMMCLQLFTMRDTIGALNLFSEKAKGFSEESRDVGLIFASHAAVALAGARTEAHLTEAISSRQRIGEATGLLAERYGLTTTAAFTMLVQISQNHNVKVRELAVRLVNEENAARAKPGE